MSKTLIKQVALAGTLTGLLATGSVAFSSTASAVPLTTPDFTEPVEDYADRPGYDCLQSEPKRAGVWGFRDLVMAAYPRTTSGAIWAPCNTHSPNSEHHAGRAWDWMISKGGQAPDGDRAAMAYEVIDWLTEDEDGAADMRLRRLGIRYMIFDGKIWSSSTREWGPYSPGNVDCADKHQNITTCHRDHVHFTFSEAGADGDTSWWRGRDGKQGDDGGNPADNCGSDADTVNSASILNSTDDLIAVVELRRSAKCNTYWSRVTSHTGGRAVKATIDRDGTSYSATGSGGVWSPMVQARNGSAVCALAQVWFNDKSGAWPVQKVCA